MEGTDLMGEFFIWLGHLPTWLGILLFFIVLASFFGFSYFVVKIGLRIKFRDTEISLFGRRRKTTETELPYSPHRDCAYKSDIVLLLNTVNQLQYKKFHLLEVDLLKEQMKYVEQKVDLIRSVLQRQYLQILQDKKTPELTSNIGFLNYKNVLSAIQMEIIDHLRHIMRENHLNNMDETKFLQYCEDKFIFLSNEVTEYLNSLYVSTEVITREELHDWNKKIVPELRLMIYDMFQNARKIASDCIKKAKELDKQINNEVNKYI